MMARQPVTDWQHSAQGPAAFGAGSGEVGVVAHFGVGPSLVAHTPGMPVTIRPATAADQPTIVRMVRQAQLNPMDVRWFHFVVAEDGGSVVGIGQVKQHRDGSRELASMAVVEDRQGQGIGSSIIQTLLAREPRVLHLTCRRELQGYYERFGFRRLERADYPPYFRRVIPCVNLMGPLMGTRIIVMRRDP